LRIACTAIHDDQKATSAVAFLCAAIADYTSLGITVTRVMTDNGACDRAHAFRQACTALDLRHIRTRPYTPRTNGKAERFIRTSRREWAYARAYTASAQRADELPHWTHMYNWHRPHAGLNSKPPISVLNHTQDNLLRLHS
jgi:transposase InsO family protein